MNVEIFNSIIGSDFFTGVPDSQLKALCDYLMDTYGIDSKHHIIAANEGNAAALAAGYHLATGKIPVVYMQNSGEGNIINPVASLLNSEVYAIPVIFIIGWRGEPGEIDEPQHVFQGKITLKLLSDVDIKFFVIDKNTLEQKLTAVMNDFRNILASGKSVAFIIRKNALSYNKRIDYVNKNIINRETVIHHIIKASGKDPIVSTTGKISRELFEARESNGQCHNYDFLTVGAMGHSSSIAFGIALNKPNTRVWCIDGDGAILMHMGAMAILGSIAPRNMIHIVINNEAHETVGGMPTAASHIELVAIAKACGYPYAVCVNSLEGLDEELYTIKRRNTLSFIEVKCSIGSRENLGRPTTRPVKNKLDFMEYLKNIPD